MDTDGQIHKITTPWSPVLSLKYQIILPWHDYCQLDCFKYQMRSTDRIVWPLLVFLNIQFQWLFTKLVSIFIQFFKKIYRQTSFFNIFFFRFTWNKLTRFLLFITCTSLWKHTWKIVLDRLRTTSEMTTSWLHWNFQKIKENIKHKSCKTIFSIYSFSDQQ